MLPQAIGPDGVSHMLPKSSTAAADLANKESSGAAQRPPLRKHRRATPMLEAAPEVVVPDVVVPKKTKAKSPGLPQANAALEKERISVAKSIGMPLRQLKKS